MKQINKDVNHKTGYVLSLVCTACKIIKAWLTIELYESIKYFVGLYMLQYFDRYVIQLIPGPIDVSWFISSNYNGLRIDHPTAYW